MTLSFPLKRYRKFLTWLAFPIVLSRLFDANRARRNPVSHIALTRMALTAMRTPRRVLTASLGYEHLTMIAALLAVPEDTRGIVVECGCFKGGSTVNLSMGCAIAGRELHVYDSFQGLPEPTAPDVAHTILGRPEIHTYEAGMYAGGVEEVRGNVTQFGRVDVCSFHVGFFSESMADLSDPCILGFVDVDLRSSLEDCVRALWPRLVDGGSLYIHEAEHREIVDFFYDREWWRTEFAADPPGLIGGGSGLGLEPGDGVWGSALAFTTKQPPLQTYTKVAG